MNCRTCELFHTPAGTAFADLVINRHRETWPVRSGLRDWLRAAYYEGRGGRRERGGGARSPICSRPARNSPLPSGRSTSASPNARRAHLSRSADAHWRAVEFGPDGWRIVVGPSGALPPAGRAAAASASAARRVDRAPSRCLLNLSEPRTTFVLVVTWLLAALRPSWALSAAWRFRASRGRPRPC